MTIFADSLSYLRVNAWCFSAQHDTHNNTAQVYSNQANGGVQTVTEDYKCDGTAAIDIISTD